MPRDTQRSKLYAAERATFNDADWRNQAMDLADCEALVRRIERSASWAKLMAERPHPIYGGWGRITVEAGRGGGMAHGTNLITLGVYGRRPWVILHELAHLATTRVHGDHAAAAHGWQFASIYLRLVRRWLGKPERDALRAAFRAHGVRYTAPRAKRQLTDEQKAELTARLARAREARAARPV